MLGVAGWLHLDMLEHGLLAAEHLALGRQEPLHLRDPSLGTGRKTIKN